MPKVPTKPKTKIAARKSKAEPANVPARQPKKKPR